MASQTENKTMFSGHKFTMQMRCTTHKVSLNRRNAVKITWEKSKNNLILLARICITTNVFCHLLQSPPHSLHPLATTVNGNVCHFAHVSFVCSCFLKMRRIKRSRKKKRHTDESMEMQMTQL